MSLIQGFNTFLPQGYRIECSSDGQETNLITVTTPTGTTTSTSHSQGGVGTLSRIASTSANLPVPVLSVYGIAPSPGFGPIDGPSTPLTQLPNPLSPTLGPLHPSTPSGSGVGAAILGGLHNQPSALKGPPALPVPAPEFNHAIQYVNKIKNRFADDPDTYKQFLEILQTYQKEQRPIQDVRLRTLYFCLKQSC
jgi:paired amphipathic helix protein Sin3a